MMLEIRDLVTGYGNRQVLNGVSMNMRAGRIVALIGPNGAGKSTVLKAIYGLVSIWSGEVLVSGRRANAWTPMKKMTQGIVYAPQGSRVFGNMTVIENLEMGAFKLTRKIRNTRIERVFVLFPTLEKLAYRDARWLSGGEQQMLALARALVPKPKVLLLDEPSHGLSPDLSLAVFEKIAELVRNESIGVLVVEQKVRQVLDICTSVYSLKMGHISYFGEPEVLKGDKERLRVLFM